MKATAMQAAPAIAKMLDQYFIGMYPVYVAILRLSVNHALMEKPLAR